VRASLFTLSLARAVFRARALIVCVWGRTGAGAATGERGKPARGKRDLPGSASDTRPRKKKRMEEGKDARGADDGGDAGGSAMSVVDLVQEKWYVALLLFGLVSIVREAKSKAEAFKQGVALTALIYASVRLERYLSVTVIRPLLDKILGSNDEMRRRIEVEEEKMRQTLARLKAQAPE